MHRSSLRRLTVAALTAGLAAAGVVLAPAAQAAPVATVMVSTQRMTGPALPPKHAQDGWYAKGARLTLSCHARGQSVKGYYSPWLPNGGYDNLWYRVSDGRWVADVDINTGSNNPVVGACTAAPAPSGFMLPFTRGSRVTVTQSPGGSYSHRDTYNRHAVDFGVRSGTPVLASGSGRVYFEGWTRGGGGIQVLIDHGNGRCTQYAHLSRTVVDRGWNLSRGRLIGYSGTTGGVAPHLHWNMVNCSTHTSREVVNTVERGTSYPAGAVVVSANG